MEEDKKEIFLRKLEEVLELKDNTLTCTTSLESIDWDSLAIISSIAVVDEIFGKVISADNLAKCKTLDDILDLT